MDVNLLQQLTIHDYTLITRAASIRLEDLFGDEALRILSSAIKSDVTEQQGRSLASAIRFAEVEHYGVANVW